MAFQHPFEDANIIYMYSRKQALDDGLLVDISRMARHAGFRCPATVTHSVWNMIQEIPEKYENLEDVDGRLWDVLWSAVCSANGSDARTELTFQVILRTDEETVQTLKMVSGPDDDGFPCLTIMLPEED